MKKASSKYILCFSIALVFILLFYSFTCTNAASSEVDTPIFSYKEIAGNSAYSTKELFSMSQNQNPETSVPVLTDMALFYENGVLNLKGTFSHNEETVSIDTCGEIYKNERTEHSGEAENLVLVDMEEIGNWHFVQFRIDKDHSYIMIILQHISTYELVQFLVPITEKDFEMFYNLHENSLSGEELELKILELYSVGRNILNRETPDTGGGEVAAPGSQDL